MIRSLSTAAVAALALTPIAFADTKTYDVSGFTNLDVSAGLDVEFTTGGNYSVVAENRKGDFSDIEIYTSGDTLYVKRPKRSGWGWGQRKRYQVTVSAPSLSNIEASSGSDVIGSGLTGSSISIDVSSGADVAVSDIRGGTVRLETSSGSDLTASGTCDTVRADASSGSDIEAGQLVCANGSAEASSGSDITVHVTGKMTADVSSGADIMVRGGPTETDIDKSSGGDVTIRG
ncbi:MAG: head GIN domain-containing protein [Pseudomonadota bacterium]